MRLFHGAIGRVEVPRVMAPDFYRPLDFGTGFYTTTDLEQAKRWVANRLRHSKDAVVGFVSVYELDEDKLDGLTVKRFDGVSSEWLKFIAENRLRFNVEHGFDVVTGAVANDRVYTVLTLYEGGYIDSFRRRLRWRLNRLLRKRGRTRLRSCRSSTLQRCMPSSRMNRPSTGGSALRS